MKKCISDEFFWRNESPQLYNCISCPWRSEWREWESVYRFDWHSSSSFEWGWVVMAWSFMVFLVSRILCFRTKFSPMIVFDHDYFYVARVLRRWPESYSLEYDSFLSSSSCFAAKAYLSKIYVVCAVTFVVVFLLFSPYHLYSLDIVTFWNSKAIFQQP